MSYDVTFHGVTQYTLENLSIKLTSLGLPNLCDSSATVSKNDLTLKYDHDEKSITLRVSVLSSPSYLRAGYIIGALYNELVEHGIELTTN